MHGRVQSESLAATPGIRRRLLDFTDRSDGHGLDRATLDGIKRAKRGSHEVATGADLMTGEQSRLRSHSAITYIPLFVRWSVMAGQESKL